MVGKAEAGLLNSNLASHKLSALEDWFSPAVNWVETTGHHILNACDNCLIFCDSLSKLA